VAINDGGQVAGFGSGRAEMKAFLTAPRQPINANTIELDINDGSTRFADIDIEQRVLLRQFQVPRGPWLSINNLGQVAGTYNDLRAVNISDLHGGLGMLGGIRTGEPVTRTALPFRAFRTRPGRPIDPDTDDLGSLDPGASSNQTWPVDINIRGQVVGRSCGRGFRTGPNRPIDPTTDELSFHPFAINDAGWTVGASADFYGRPIPPVYIDDGTKPYKLNEFIDPASGWKITLAIDINNRGQILAMGSKSGGARQDVLLDPVPDYRPLYWLLAGTSLTGLVQAGRYRRAAFQRRN
jgi:hypothetical protein